MIEKFNGVFYLILFVMHFLGVGAYAYQMIIGNQNRSMSPKHRLLGSPNQFRNPTLILESQIATTKANSVPNPMDDFQTNIQPRSDSRHRK
jgi:hypothetical protein